jgi:putative metallohydrolase (TIGR04338 family)
MAVRDSQRSKLYAAENSLGTLHCEDEYATTSACRAYIVSVLGDTWVRQEFGQKICESMAQYVIIKDGRGRRMACFRGWHTIVLPKWARGRWVMLHELAHMMVDHQRSWNYCRPVAAHGPEFAWVYMRLVRHALGPNESTRLQGAFVSHRVRYRTVNPFVDKRAAKKF